QHSRAERPGCRVPGRTGGSRGRSKPRGGWLSRQPVTRDPPMEGLIAWTRAIHVSALLLWSASLLALPALRARYPVVSRPRALQRLAAVARFPFVLAASLAGVVTIMAGTVLIHPTGAYSGGLVLKLLVVGLMVLGHAACVRIVVLLHDHP